MRDFGWGSYSVARNQAMLLLIANRFAPSPSFTEAALNNLHYFLGRNCHGVSWVTGLGTRPFQHPHHRPSAADNVVAPWPGLLSAGPNVRPAYPDAKRLLPPAAPMRMWVDHQGAYSVNEVAINWNAPLVFLLPVPTRSPETTASAHRIGGIMQALLLSAYNHLELATLSTPEPGPDEVLIQVAACGICGSDVHGYDGSSGRRIPPIVMGHEAAGTIAALGSAVTGFAVGDRVTFDSTVYCGHCAFCQRGEVNLCDNRQVVGVSCPDFRRAGAFAEYVTVPARILYPLPGILPFPAAAMLEAVSVALHAIKVADLKGGESALVLGAGMIGLLLLQAARVSGCSPIIVADIDDTRLALAKCLGADHVVNASGEALVQAILERTGNHGVDTVFEVVGRNETVAAAIDAVRKGGTVTLVGNIAKEVTLPLQKVVTRQIRLQGSCASAGEYPEAIELVSSGQIQVDRLITAVAPLDDGPAWFARLHAREPNLMKVVLDPRPCSQMEGHPA